MKFLDKEQLGKIREEITKRWFLFAVVGVYIVVGILFSVLIYRYHWDQPATRYAARIYPFPAAKVNGQVIWLSTYYRRLTIFEHYAKRVEAEQSDILPEDVQERNRATLSQLVDDTLLAQQARKNSINVTSKEATDEFNKIQESKGGADNFQKVLQDYYGLTSAQFIEEFVPEQLYQDKIQQQLFTQIKLRHIVAKDEATAKEIIGKLDKGEKFEDLAKSYSQDVSTRDQGGDLGWIQRGQLSTDVSALESAAFNLQAGQYSKEPIQTKYGWHVIIVDERKDAPITDKSFTQWFDEIRNSAKIAKYVAN